MENYMNNVIIEDIEELITSIENSDIYIHYKDVYNRLKENSDIKNLIIDIKKINKSLVLNPSIKLEEELNIKTKALNQIPLYQDYLEKQEELNNLLIVVKNKIDIFMRDILID